jgi:rhodanese-related sulfurtransferase
MTLTNPATCQQNIAMNLPSVHATTLKQWLEKGEVSLIDVREPAEFQGEHIPQASNIPLTRIQDGISVKLPPGLRKVLQCKGGRRARIAASLLQENSPQEEFWYLDGGIDAWKDAGLPVISSSKTVLPLDQQVKILIGSLILLFIILGFKVSAGYFYGAGLIGVAMIVGGITGVCAVTMALARMPWNQRASTCEVTISSPNA